MATFCVLVSPLPYVVRKRLFRFLSESPIVAKIAYGLKISFMFVTSIDQSTRSLILMHTRRFVGILFADALQRMFRVTAESEMAKSGGQGPSDVRTETNIAARKF